MTRTTITRTINAPIELVFQTVADINNFSNAIPAIMNVEFMSETRTGVGTRFRETRLMKGQEASTELEVIEYVPNDRGRLVADSHGTVWDTLFTVQPDNGHTKLTMIMDAKAYKLIPRIMNPIFRGMIQKVIERDLDAVKSYCEP